MSRSQDIERAITEHAHVAECTVADLADLYRGETVTAFVVMRNDIETSLSSVWDHVRRVLPGDRQPDRVHVVDELPDNPVEEALARAGSTPDESE